MAKGGKIRKETEGRPPKEKLLSQIITDFESDIPTPKTWIDNDAVKEIAQQQEKHNTQKELAKKAGMSTGQYAKAEQVDKNADEEIKERLRKGETTIGKEYARIKQQKFAKGGSGILQGPSHAGGGINVGIGEAEGGEHIAITSRRMTAKYGAGTLDAIAKSINQGKFFEVWSDTNNQMNDPYTKRIFDLLKGDFKVYTDSDGNTVKEYKDGRRYVIKKSRDN